MPASFQFPKRGPHINGEPAQVWTPLALSPFERSAQARGMMYNHTVVGRLRADVAPEQAISEAGALGSTLVRNYPPVLQGPIDSLMITAVPLIGEIAGQVQRPLLILLGAVALVLLVACANVANLVLSRAVTRQREISVRAALGAGRRRLLQMLLVEGLLLTAAGGVLGLFIGYAVVRAMPDVIALSLPGVQDVRLDGRVVLFTFALSALTALVFGLLPLIVSERRDLTDLLREGGARSIGGVRHQRVQAMLVVSSVALAVVLLASAGLLMRSFTKLMAVDTGIRAPRVLTMQLRLPQVGYNSGPAVRSFYQGLHDRVRAIPSVRAAAIQTDLPLKGDGERRAFTADQAVDPGNATGTVAVTWTFGDYFPTFGVPIVKGRGFLPEEDLENRGTAIVSRALAERYWPGQDPIGKRLKWGIAASRAPWQTVVGVAGDVVDGKLGEPPIMHIYVPFAEAVNPPPGLPMAGLVRRMTVAAVTDQDAATLDHSNASGDRCARSGAGGGRGHDDGAGDGGGVGAAAIQRRAARSVRVRRAAARRCRTLRDARVRRRPPHARDRCATRPRSDPSRSTRTGRASGHDLDVGWPGARHRRGAGRHATDARTAVSDRAAGSGDLRVSAWHPRSCRAACVLSAGAAGGESGADGGAARRLKAQTPVVGSIETRHASHAHSPLGFQFKSSVSGEAGVSPTRTLMRNRPSRLTSY